MNIYFNEFLEKPCKILSPLTDLWATESETVSLVVMLSKPRNVAWFIKDKQISSADDRFKQSVSENGTEHSLLITSVSHEENCTFRADVDNKEYGIISSSCSVSVKGWHFLLNLFHKMCQSYFDTCMLENSLDILRQIKAG